MRDAVRCDAEPSGATRIETDKEQGEIESPRGDYHSKWISQR